MRSACHDRLAEAGDFELTPALEAALDELATAARAGDPAARNALYQALAFKIARFIRSSRRVAGGLEPDELTSEAFLTLADLIAAWPGRTFGRFFLLAYPFRLRRALRRAAGRPSWHRPSLEEAATIAAPNGDLALAAGLAELETGLGPADRRLLRARVLHDLTVAELTAVTGLPPRTTQRRWRALVAALRLAEAKP